DWTDGAFTQVTTANDNAIQEKRYSGAKDYIRTVAKVLNAACVFGTSVVRSTGSVVQDDQLTDDIQTAREQAEVETRRKLLTQTWDYFFEFFPSENNFIDIPFGNLQSVTYIKYIDSDGDITTLTEDTDYIVETNGEECGRVILPYAGSWPSFTPFPSHPIVIRFVCGWESAAEIPRTIKTAVKEIAARLYTMRGDPTIGKGQYVVEDEFYRRLLYDHRIFKDL
ncbi:MAG TPA: hypothetical protein VKA27_04870, partial [Sunxiuqinia sp.]|nr:hypothetical protein [Sunxiuqinia sp.]